MSAVDLTQSTKPGQPASPPARRSRLQQQGEAALARVMWLWEDLTDEEREAWRREAKRRRKRPLNYFKEVNLRRARNGLPCLRLPPLPERRSPTPLLSRLIIHNRGGRLRLFLELRRFPECPTTLWGALPCRRGRAQPHKCPRLGWLEPAPDGLCDITQLYYAKHGEFLTAESPYLAGLRIFIRTRPELDYGKPLFEEVHALIPPPEDLKNP